MTPCEKLGYKVGDRFVAKRDGGSYLKGDPLTLNEDDGTEAPFFKNERSGHNCCAHLERIEKAHGTKTQLRPGDYVSTEGMTEEQYHAVANAFLAIGVRHGEYPNFEYTEIDESPGKPWCFGDYRGALWHGFSTCFRGRFLTIEQVLGEEEDETATIQSLLKKADKHARKAQKHEEKRKEAIEQARAMLPDGWELTPSIDHDVRIGYTPLSELSSCEFNVGVFGADGEDLNDPDNWREGDFVTVEKIDFERYDWWTKGKFYKVFFSERLNGLCVKSDDGDCYSVSGDRLASPGHFKFHHRP